MLLFLTTALAVGFLGSFHCIGMCGPLALALPIKANNRYEAFFLRLLYNSGRILTYSFIGLVAGSFGQFISLRGWQSALSIVAGFTVLLIAVFTSGATMRYFDKKTVAFTFKLKQLLGNQIQQKSHRSLIMVGIINGFLPCGFVYLALAGALTGGSIANGALYMFFFGLGTLPMMLGISFIAQLLQSKARKLVSRYSMVVGIALGIFLIYRGTMLQFNSNYCHGSTSKTNPVTCPIR
jgi:sulfite exporter TauE/SafE